MKEKLKKHHNILSELPDVLNSYEESEVSFPTLGLSSPFWLIAIGKASLKTTFHILEEYKDQIVEGLIISDEDLVVSDQIQSFRGSHPIPNNYTVAASYEIVDFAKRIPQGETLLFCISGGASSMFVIPPFGIEVAELQELYLLLLESGLSIQDMNVVRKHVCDMKGGKFAEEIQHLELISVIDSDVPENDISTVGSGPTIPDPSNFEDAFNILSKAKIWGEVPLSIQEHIIGGMEGYVPENPKPDKNEHPSHRIELVSKSEDIKLCAKSFLEESGYEVWIDDGEYSGSVREVSKRICSKAIGVLSGNDELKKPVALIFNGESTVRVIGKGKGGRNQELALMAALSIEGQHSISILSMDTDGIDGPTEVAGAIINSETTLKARKNKLEPEKLLKENNSYEFHKSMSTHIVTGKTGVNAMDLQIVLIE